MFSFHWSFLTSQIFPDFNFKKWGFFLLVRGCDIFKLVFIEIIPEVDLKMLLSFIWLNGFQQISFLPIGRPQYFLSSHWSPTIFSLFPLVGRHYYLLPIGCIFFPSGFLAGRRVHRPNSRGAKVGHSYH